MMEGFRGARRVGWVGGTILLISVSNLGIIGAERLALPRAAAGRYGQLGGYGATVIAIVAGRSRPPREPGRTTYVAALVQGLATLSFGRCPRDRRSRADRAGVRCRPAARRTAVGDQPAAQHPR